MNYDKKLNEKMAPNDDIFYKKHLMEIAESFDENIKVYNYKLRKETTEELIREDLKKISKRIDKLEGNILNILLLLKYQKSNENKIINEIISDLED